MYDVYIYIIRYYNIFSNRNAAQNDLNILIK